MTQLGAMQQAFQDYILRDAAGIGERIERDERVDPERRLRIYHDAYRLRLIEVLGSDYEAVRALLGAEAFDHACRAYVEATPSVHRNVRWYGAGFPEFLRRTPPWAQQPIAHEVALFEWTLTLAFDAPDANVVRFEDLASLPAEAWPVLGFVLHPSARRIELGTNAPAFRKAADAGEPIPEVALANEPRPWLIWRKELNPCFRSLGEPEAWALDAVQAGANFTALCEGLCRWFDPEQAAPQAAALLRQWVDDELISDLTSSNAEPGHS
jgi:Putative DNA-binding domain